MNTRAENRSPAWAMIRSESRLMPEPQSNTYSGSPPPISTLTQDVLPP
jgi:hypothetical protein